GGADLRGDVLEVLLAAPVEQGRDVDLVLDQGAALLDGAQLRGGQAHVGADHDQAVVQTALGDRDGGGIDHLRAALSGQGPHEGGAAAGDEGAALGLELPDGAHDDLHVGVLGGVDDHPAAVPGAGEDLPDPVDAAVADVRQGDAEHVGRGHRSPGAL